MSSPSIPPRRLRVDFAPIEVPPRYTAIAAQPGVLVGREAALARLGDLLRDPSIRLVTLTGPGGAGKTRLALEVAAAHLDDFERGACLVELAAVRETRLVLPAIATALGLRETLDQAPLAALVEHLGSSELLLVLDNFEHVLAAARDVSLLLAACPSITIVVTSRAALRLRWEHEFPVPPLALPDLEQLPPVEQLAQVPSVALFAERARAVRPDLLFDQAVTRCAAEICVRLDGLPLALELAAARVRLLSPAALLARLERRLDVLTAGPADVPERHRGLRAAIDWSYDLLDEPERRWFRWLGVFVGGFSLEAAGRLMGSPDDTLDRVGSLLDKSLVRLDPAAEDAEPRVHMLETLREYALDRLRADGELETARERHADVCAALAEQAAAGLAGPDQARALAGLEREHGNLRAALDWAFSSADRADLGARLAAVLWPFWSVRAHVREASHWLARALDADGIAPARRVQVLVGAGQIARERNEFVAAAHYLEQGLALQRALGDRHGEASTLNRLGEVARYTGDLATAEAYYQQSLAAHRELGDRRGIGSALVHLGVIARNRGDYARAVELYEQSLALRRELGDRRGIALALKNLGDAWRDQGDHGRAIRLYQASLGLRWELGDAWGVALCLEGLGLSLIARQDAQRGVQVCAAADRLRNQVGSPIPPSERDAWDGALAAARAQLGSDGFEVAWQIGQARPTEAVVGDALAMALPAEPAQRTGAPAPADPLSRREREVAELIARGLTNREIAAELIVSERTVDAHVEHIRAKLGVRSRTQIATWLMQQAKASG